ncbi:hypothetical protein [Butyrivibrio sp. NC3005]|uniref:hypothetical protein n=1 Tax=Butyrivibrio sp. NC3005 TaxID=1280685 RepID=UPI000415D517|nr:hypothetical protein [Butyrivibrio sp. NC3005]
MRRLIVTSMCLLSLFSASITSHAASANYGVNPSEAAISSEVQERDSSSFSNGGISVKSKQSKSYTINGNKGTLTANAWRTSLDGKKVNNTLQWDYQVSAVYAGSYEVEYIKTQWNASASLRNSASITLGVSDTGVSAGVSSSWQTVKTATKYYMNTKGQKTVDYRSNVIVTPAKDYRSSTISVINTASVKLKKDKKVYSISAGA